MANKAVSYFLVLDSADGEDCVTVACVTVKKGRTDHALRMYRKQLDARGMWHAPLHPRAASVLLKKLEMTTPYTEAKGLSASDAAALCAAGDPPNAQP